MSSQEVQSKINLLLGQKAWGVSIGHGSFLTLEFGQPLPLTEQCQKIQGEWHLWIYCCVWRLEEGNKILAVWLIETALIASDSSSQSMSGMKLASLEAIAPNPA